MHLVERALNIDSKTQDHKKKDVLVNRIASPFYEIDGFAGIRILPLRYDALDLVFGIIFLIGRNR